MPVPKNTSADALEQYMPGASLVVLRAGDPMLVRERAYFYAIKFLARVTGRINE